MPNYEYKCVSVPTIVNTKAGAHNEAVSVYEQAINNAATNGWELDKIDTVSSSQPPGCMGVLTGQKETIVSFKLLVFRREKK